MSTMALTARTRFSPRVLLGLIAAVAVAVALALSLIAVTGGTSSAGTGTGMQDTGSCHHIVRGFC